MQWKNDTELFELMERELYTPVVGDVLDSLGFYHQILPPQIKPLKQTYQVAGRAMPVLQADVYGEQEKPFGFLTDALDQLKEGEIYITTGGTMCSAYWGELLTATAKTRKARGAIIYGYHRDTPQVLEQDWPVFSLGGFCQDSRVRTQVIQYRCAIEIGGVSIKPHDVLFADYDGVVVIPKDLVNSVVTASLEKARGEKVVRKAIEAGMSATMAFDKFGIL